MRTEEWFGFWIDRHMERHPREDWPNPAEARNFWQGWLGNFVLHGVTEDVADEASARLMADPPRFLGEHPKAVLDACRAIFRERSEAGRGGDPNSREAAELASRDCRDCVGQGLTVRYRKLSAGTVDGQGRPHSPAITLYCTCGMGRFLEKVHRDKHPDIRKRIYDLADHPFLWGDEYREPPRDDDPPAPVAVQSEAF